MPLVGAFIMAAYPLAEIAPRPRLLAAAAGLLLAAWTAATWVQIGHWRDSMTLFGHALAVTPENCVVHNNLGPVLERAGRGDEAEQHYRQAIRLNDRYLDPT